MDQQSVPSAHDSKIILEENIPLSQSLLWQLQRNFYAEQGVDGWRNGIIPHYITSNPFIAGAYAKVVLSFLRDLVADTTLAETVKPLDRNQPVYLVELGAGSGRFSFHFLKKFLRLLQHSTLRDIAVKYVMTDVAQRNLTYWQSHPSLEPFVTQGHLDFACFDAGHDNEIRLIHSGETLAAGTVTNPLVVIANYVFDSLPQDLFLIKDGQIYQNRVTVTSSRPEPDLTDPELLNRCAISYAPHAINGDYYADQALNQILLAYQQRLSESVLLFPTGAARCVSDLSTLASGRFMLLSADKGYSREGDLLGRGEPAINKHGNAFSLMVNYHALGEYVQRQGGYVLHPTHRHANLTISALLLGDCPRGYRETRQAYDEVIAQFGPDDFFVLKEGVEQVVEHLTLPHILAYLRLCSWDNTILLACFPRLMEQLEASSLQDQQELCVAIHQVWDWYYHIGEGRDLAFHLSMLLYGMAYYPEALEYLQRSLQLYGADPNTVHNMALCHYNLRQLEPALAYAEQALQLDPALEATKGLRIMIEEERSYMSR